ncbi:MAG: phosphatase PAP2 family protein [Candidatus Aminicenantes bacterium]|nr:phosphatase PAP2 family protein [Candidatus Aminicenantes bacterium]
MSDAAERLRGKDVARLYGRTIRLLGIDFQIMDAFLLGGLAVQAALFLLFFRRIDQPLLSAAKNAGLAALYIAAVFVLPKAKSQILYFLLRTGSAQLLFAYLFDAVRSLQMVLFPWQDRAVMAAEKAVFGLEPTIWLERFISVPLTEWMMFSYVIYVLFYPLTAALIFFKHGKGALEDYLFTLAVVNLACDIGFILFPVASPFWYMPEAYSVPLKGGLFTRLGELIRAKAHFAGGSIPSPHCSVGTVIWMMSFRYVRRWFYLIAPVMLTLYVSTVYGRYHYVTDSIAGIILGLAAMMACPSMVRAWNRRAEQRRVLEVP